jgi:hypothetical protein
VAENAELNANVQNFSPDFSHRLYKLQTSAIKSERSASG